MPTSTPAASPEAAHAHFAARLALETDPEDVAAGLRAAGRPFTVLDVRSAAAYDAAHLPGAISLPGSAINAEAVATLPEGLLVLYCWGPGCNGAHKAAAKLTAHGRQVKEMIGGFEYWVREGHPVEGHAAADLHGDEPGLVWLAAPGDQRFADRSAGAVPSRR